MVNVVLVLKVGRIKNHIFEVDDEYDMQEGFESIHEILDVVADPISDRAILAMHVTGWANDRTVASFKRIKLKTKNGENKFKWIVVE